LHYINFLNVTANTLKSYILVLIVMNNVTAYRVCKFTKVILIFNDMLYIM